MVKVIIKLNREQAVRFKKHVEKEHPMTRGRTKIKGGCDFFPKERTDSFAFCKEDGRKGSFATCKTGFED